MSKKTNSILEVKPEHYKDFSCGNKSLDEYLKRYAKGNHKKGLGKTFVLEERNAVAGFYTISMGSIDFSAIPEDYRKFSLPKYPIPIAKIGRLAVDEQYRKKGLGKFLLIDAFNRIYNASQFVAAFATVVDAIDENAKNFYKHFGFTECFNSKLTLFLPIETTNKLFINSDVQANYDFILSKKI